MITTVIIVASNW